MRRRHGLELTRDPEQRMGTGERRSRYPNDRKVPWRGLPTHCRGYCKPSGHKCPRERQRVSGRTATVKAELC